MPLNAVWHSQRRFLCDPQVVRGPDTCKNNTAPGSIRSCGGSWVGEEIGNAAAEAGEEGATIEFGTG
jgi:hypothetical protein